MEVGAALTLLALDTSTPLAAVAVVRLATDAPRQAPPLAVAVREQRVTTHSETLLCLVSACLDELGLRPADLSAVACGAGPGSFTGLRIGAATAKGLCFALGVPLVMASSLEALAAPLLAAAEPTAVLAAQDAFRGQVYARLFPAGDPAAAALLAEHPALAEDRAWDPDELAAALRPLAALHSCGDGGVRYPQLARGIPPTVLAPSPLWLARLAADRLRRGPGDDLFGAAPRSAALSAAEEAQRP